MLYRESSAGRFRINRKVIGAYLTVSILHGLWDGLPAVVAMLLSPGLDVFIAQALVAVMGLFILWRRWREATRQQAAQMMAAEMDGCGEAIALEARAAGL